VRYFAALSGSDMHDVDEAISAVGLDDHRKALAANLSGRDGGDAEAENRTLAPFPVLNRSLASIRAYGPGLDDWFSDHFRFRSDLIRWYGESRYFGFGVSPSPMVIRGENGWLYYEEDGGIEDYANEPLLDADALHAWHETVVRARDWCKARGIAYVFVIAPDKHKIYPEHYDPHIHPVATASRTDQVLEALADTGVAVDVRPAMMAAKADDRLFHLTDTHWNDRGAFVAYQQIIEAVRKQRPAVPPAHDRSTFNATSRIVEGRDLAATIGLKRCCTRTTCGCCPRPDAATRCWSPPAATRPAAIRWW
jgi:hypothetical protein